MYNKLKTKYINKYNTKHIDASFLVSILKYVAEVCPFSTFGYIKGYNSYDCLDHTDSGNCISMCILLTRICSHYNIISFLIPATVPKKYKKNEAYLDISHVAVCIPFESYVYILDPAFYFMEPMLVDLSSTDKLGTIDGFDIELNKVSKINYKLKTHMGTMVLNHFQTLPKNTAIVECNYVNDITDIWNYYLVEVTNPDEAISSFYITINQFPFMASLNPDYSIKYFVRFLDNKTILVEKNYKEIYKGEPKNMSLMLQKQLAPYKLDFSLPRNIGLLDFNIV
tara:strand:+ start:115 stop:960 length:846 start_codon:yes stop_codon:yes gene_type:complete